MTTYYPKSMYHAQTPGEAVPQPIMLLIEVFCNPWIFLTCVLKNPASCGTLQTLLRTSSSFFVFFSCKMSKRQ